MEVKEERPEENGGAPAPNPESLTRPDTETWNGTELPIPDPSLVQAEPVAGPSIEPELMDNMYSDSSYTDLSSSDSENNQQVVTTRTYRLSDLYFGESLLVGKAGWNKERWGNFRPLCGGVVLIPPAYIVWWLLELLSVALMMTMVYERAKHSQIFLILSGVSFAVLLLSSFFALFWSQSMIVKPDYVHAVRNSFGALDTREFWRRDGPYKRVHGRDMKYCTKCHNYVKMEVTHCDACGLCITNYEHHCLVIGICVSRSNAKSFFVMTFSATVYNVLLLISSVSVVWNSSGGSIITKSFVLTELIAGWTLLILIMIYKGVRVHMFKKPQPDSTADVP